MGDWEALAAACVDTDWGSLVSAERRRAALVLADTVGAIIAGSRTPEGAMLARALAEADGDRPGGAWIPGAQRRVSAHTAAYAYGMLGTWLELDEAAAAGVHAAIHVAAAVLAVGQATGAPGRRVLDGIVAGYEATAALYERTAAPYPVHPHAGLAAVGGAVGVAVTLGVDHREPARIAATLPVIPVWDACFEGATARHAFAGAAAAAAVRAVELAGAGVTGSAGALDRLFVDVLDVPAAEVAPPDASRPRILASTIKQHAACMTCHTAIEAALAVAPDDPAVIASVRVWTTADVADKVGRPANDTVLSGRFSLPYAVAAALVHRRSDPAAFAPDPRVATLAARVEVLVDPGLPDADHAMPARVELTTVDGARRTHEVRTVAGSTERPVDDEAIRAKFRANGGDDGLLARIERIDERADVRDLLVPAIEAAGSGAGLDAGTGAESAAGARSGAEPDAGPGSGDESDAVHVATAVRLAAENAAAGQHPFGAVVTLDGALVATGVNRVLATGDPCAHAEVDALRNAVAARGDRGLDGAVVHASSEPCPVCAALATLLGVARMTYATTTAESAARGFTMNAGGERLQPAVAAAAIPRRLVAITGRFAGFDAFDERGEPVENSSPRTW